MTAPRSGAGRHLRPVLFLVSASALGIGYGYGCAAEQPAAVESSTPSAEAPEPASEPVKAEVVAPGAIAWRLPTREAKSPVLLGSAPELADARERLAAACTTHGLDPENPWAIDHAMLVVGAEGTLPNGKNVVDWLFEQYAEPVTIGGEALIAFPASREAPGQHEHVRIEPHTDLLLKAFAEAGLTPDRAVTVNGKPHTLGDLYRASLHDTWVAGDQVWAASWNDTPWALQGLAAWAPEDLSWTAAGGRAMTMDAFTHGVVAKLHDETQFLRDAMAKGEQVQKKKQGIFGYTCGGAHMLQGAAFAVARGFGDEADRASIEAEIPALFYRYPIEMDAVDQALRTAPEYRTILLSQRLKFTGHFLETTHKLAAMGLFTPNAEQQQIMKRAAADLFATVAILEKLTILDNLGKMKNGPNHQMYLDYVGDACHAVRGIDLATGKGTVLY